MTPLRLLLMGQVHSCGSKAFTSITGNIDLRSKATFLSNAMRPYKDRVKLHRCCRTKPIQRRKPKLNVYLFTRVSARLATVECDPCSAPCFPLGCCRLNVFPRLAAAKYFAALCTSYIFSRASLSNLFSDMVPSTFADDIIDRVNIFVEDYERKPRMASFSPCDFPNRG